MSRGTLDHTSSFLVSTTGLLPSMAELSNSLHLRYCIHVVCPQPQRSKLHWFGLFRVRSPLLTESNFFLFLRVLRCFSSPGRPPPAYVFSGGISTLPWMGSPIRRPPGRRMCAPRRGLSQLAASFVGSLCQGIRRAPVVSCGTASGPRDIHVSLIEINRYHE